MLVRLLPRRPRAVARESEVAPARRARGGVAQPLLGHETHALGRLRLPPRPGSRVDDRNRLEPPDLARGVLEARPLVGPRCVSRRRLHGEHLVVVRLHVALLARRRPGVSVQLGAARARSGAATRSSPRGSCRWSETTGSGLRRVCAQVESDFVDWCFRSFGRDASSRSWPRPGEDRRARARSRVRSAAKGECVEAAAYDITRQLHERRAGGRVLRRRFGADVARALLTTGLGIVLGRFTKTTEARVADCEALSSEAELVAACMRGGRENLPRT